MSPPSQQKGKNKILRRTFLFVIGIVAARQLTIFLSVAENRSKSLNIAIQLMQKMLAWLTSLKASQDHKTPPNPSILPKASINPQLLPPAPIPKIRRNPDSQPTVSPSQLKVAPAKKGQPIQVSRKNVVGVPLYQTTIDLTDPDTLITIGLANNAPMANSSQSSKGDEAFEKMVERYRGAVVVNGTFFGKDSQKWVLGNMVSAGKFLKYSQWENYGTTLGLRVGNQPEMITTRSEGKPEWNQHWFSITCGPRLLKQGKIWLAPKLEGFADPHVLNVGARTAIGFPASGKELYLVTFLTSLSLAEEAEVMKAMGCYEAMNLDGGASTALAHNGQILISPGRNLTNAIVVYDKNYPAPQEVKASWEAFQKGARPSYPR
ncbi:MULTISPECIES: phosphodiester glycosidase family protein [Kamptonema]|uniref:phosphodiester glycosidase family protein n=1 Tax=Kamptonema TaxID=1501433 RepID=UPI0001DAD202|nr:MULTISPECIES: phosphodiester glycosidase family protein [Kamptonema]CBN57068.1 Tat pathway signal sequence domain protein (modular protein) [Kamptonema sp. PCC 6506]